VQRASESEAGRLQLGLANRSFFTAELEVLSALHSKMSSVDLDAAARFEKLCAGGEIRPRAKREVEDYHVELSSVTTT